MKKLIALISLFAVGCGKYLVPSRVGQGASSDLIVSYVILGVLAVFLGVTTYTFLVLR